MARTKSQGNKRRASNLTESARARGGRNSRKGSVQKVMDASPVDLNEIRENISDRTESISRSFRGRNIGTSLLVGVGTYFLGKYLIRYYKDHPEISEFFSSKYDDVADRFRGNTSESSDLDARH